MNITAAYESRAFRIVDGSNIYQTVARLDATVYAEEVASFDEALEESAYYELFSTVVLRLTGLPFEFRLKTSVRNPIEYSEALYSLCRVASSVNQFGCGCFESDPLSALYVLQAFLSLPTDNRFWMSLEAVEVGTGKMFSELGALLGKVNTMIADIEGDNAFDDDALFWVDDAIRYPAGMPTADAFGWMLR